MRLLQPLVCSLLVGICLTACSGTSVYTVNKSGVSLQPKRILSIGITDIVNQPDTDRFSMEMTAEFKKCGVEEIGIFVPHGRNYYKDAAFLHLVKSKQDEFKPDAMLEITHTQTTEHIGSAPISSYSLNLTDMATHEVIWKGAGVAPSHFFKRTDQFFIDDIIRRLVNEHYIEKCSED